MHRLCMALESKFIFGGIQNGIIKPLWVKYGKVGGGVEDKSVSGKKKQ